MPVWADVAMQLFQSCMFGLATHSIHATLRVIAIPFMNYDVNAPPWWRYVVPYKLGKLVKFYYNHRIRDWQLVRDPHSSRRIYWEDPEAKVRRYTPPPFDKEVGCQTGGGLFLPDPQADSDVWSLLGASVAQLPPEQQCMIYNRLVRFIELGWHDLRARRV